MSKTIKELADELGVSKTAVRKHMSDDFRLRYTKTRANGVIYISSAGCNLIAVIMGKTQVFGVSDEAETANQEVSTEQSGARGPAVEALIEQLQAKDRQIEAQQRQIEDLTKAMASTAAALQETQKSLQAAQALHAGTLQQQLTTGAGAEAAADVDDGDKPRKKRRWPWQKGE